MSSIIALDDYNKAKEHESKYYHALNSKIDLTSKMHKKRQSSTMKKQLMKII